MKKIKRAILLVILFALIAAGIYIYRPQPVSAFLKNPSALTVTELQLDENGQWNQQSYGSPVSRQDSTSVILQNILENYNCHMTISSVFGKDSIDDITLSATITDENGDVLTITDRGILYNTRYYRAGYLDFSREENLVKEITAIAAGA